MKKKIDKKKLKGGLDLYSFKHRGMSGLLYVLAESFEEALIIFRKDFKTEIISITLVQEKIQIKAREE